MSDQIIEFRIDNEDGDLLGTLKINSTGDDQIWKTQSCKINKAKSIHDVYLVFKGIDGQSFNFDWWKLK